MTDILIVCEGNLCRSVLAARLLESALAHGDVTSVAISSAGTRAATQLEVPQQVNDILAEYGSDADEHTPRQLSASMVASASLVVTATSEQRTAAVQAHAPSVQYTYTFLQLERRLRNLDDSDARDIGQHTSPRDRLRQLVEVVQSTHEVPSDPRRAEDVVDPYGRTFDVYQEALSQMRPCLDLLSGHLGGVGVDEPSHLRAPVPAPTSRQSTDVDDDDGPTERPQPRLRGAFGWSAVSVIGRQASQIVFALYLAALIGPAQFGIVSASTIYVSLTALTLDQGLASALIQRPRLEPGVAGAVATLNIAIGIALAVATWGLAPAMADFFNAPELVSVLRALGVGLILKAVAINPRAMLMRGLRFRIIAVSEVLGGVIGAAVGIAAAMQGAGYWALVWQVIATDAVFAVILLGTRAGGRPNLHLRKVTELLPFSLRIFGARGLAFFSRNVDNILVGRYLGLTQLSAYSLAYRALSLPVQFVGQTVGRVAFPALSRMAESGKPLVPTVLQITGMLAAASVLPMTLVAVAAPELVHAVLGPEWVDAIPVLSILAIAGARETVMQTPHSLMRALGRGRLILWFEVGATVLQVTGIAIGLAWGIVGVAVGYFVAGLLLTPVLLAIQYRLVGITLWQQAAAVWPFVHAVAWGSAVYLLIRSLGMGDASTLVVGAVAYTVVAIAVLWFVHRPTVQRLVRGNVMRTRGAQ